MAGDTKNIISGIFGTENYFLIFILMPGLYIYLKHGWDQSGVDS